jgi:hypothetical protein
LANLKSKPTGLAVWGSLLKLGGSGNLKKNQAKQAGLGFILV